MRWLKKILRIIAIILPAFCLFFSSNVSAKTYQIDSFSQFSYSFYDPNHASGTDGLIPVNSVPQIWLNDMTNVNPRKVARLKSYLNGNHCIYQSDSYSNSVYNSGTSFSFGVSFIPAKPQFLSHATDNNAICRSFAGYGSTIGSVQIPTFSESNVPFNQSINIAEFVNKKTNVRYNFLYNNLYFESQRTVDGKVIDGVFYVSDLLNTGSNSINVTDRNDNYKYYGNRITRFSFPLNFDSSKEYLNGTDDIIISGQIHYQQFTEPNINVFIESKFLDAVSYGPISNTTQCATAYYGFTTAFACRITAPLSTNMYGFNFIVSGGAIDNFSTPILNASNDSDVAFIRFSSFTIRLNGDSTDGGNGSYESAGSYPNVSPGTPDNSDDSTNWFESIKNLFTFNLFNPFSAIFNMFNDNDSCVQIPILAGMLHSEDTEYCPWFDVSTRNIVTPVLGFSSMMLLFGFVMSWVKSSSGNYFEDEGRKISFGGKK